MKNKLLLAFYGDDFTGSTDALEFISRAGMKAALFIEPPTTSQLAAYSNLNAVGVAGMTRSLSPTAMEKILRPAFEQLFQLGARHVHYKVCSTFDSSPTVGSIGKAIDIGAEIITNQFIPLLVAAPPLGRYCVFGNLFARMGIGSNGKIYRLDRHPSMSYHPVTPAGESDLRLHLGKQTNKRIGLLDILQLSKPINEMEEELDQLIREGAEVILMDTLYEEQLLPIGELIDRKASDHSTLFSTGSSGIEMALGKYWNDLGIINSNLSWPDPGRAEPLLVLSGSCSPVTASQVSWAVAKGFKEIEMDTQAISYEAELSGFIENYSNEASDFLKQDYNVIVHTGGNNRQPELFPAELAGTTLGKIGKKICEQIAVKRIVVAGGDTSSYAARALGIEAVEMIAPLVPGSPLCIVYAPGSPVDGIEINFKGGQVGDMNYFGILKEGRLN